MKKRLVVFICCLLMLGTFALFSQDVSINRNEYKDRLRGFWLGSCIANWTGLQTEAKKTWIPYYTDDDWSQFHFVLDQSPWGADDDTDIEYIFQHAMAAYNTSKLTGGQIRAQWLEHISAVEENYLWVSNESAFFLMKDKNMVPPATSDPANNPNWEMIDAQLTTEIFGFYAPASPGTALDISYLPIRTTAYSHAMYAAQFYVLMYSLAANVDPALSNKEKVLWLADQARTHIPDSTYIAGMYDWVRNEYINSGDKNNWEAVRDAFHYRYMEGGADGYKYTQWYDSGSNFGLSIISLLFGEGDFKRTIQIGSLAGMDSDNPTATWGGLLGFIYSHQGLQEYFNKYDFSDEYRITRTRINFTDIDTLSNMADVGIGITDRVVTEQMGGSIEGDYWIIPGNVEKNIASEGTIIAAVTVPEGGGNPDIAIIRDGIKPAAGSDDSLSQYDTYNAAAGPAEEYVGYTFSENRTFSKVVFQEGKHFWDGGWFANGTLRIQVKSGGNWQDVSFRVSPAYPNGNEKANFGTSFETYTFTLDNVTGDGIRITGTSGGGENSFISIAELEVYESRTETVELAVSTGGTGSGTVSPGSGSYTKGSVVTLTASAAPGSSFQGWSGDVSGTAGSISVTMDSDKNITALFKKEIVNEYSLTVTPVGTGKGTITFNPPGGQYRAGTVVTVSANPAGDSEFSGYTGDVTGSSNVISVTMDNNKSINAGFNLKGAEYEYTLEETGTDGLSAVFISRSGAEYVDVQVTKNSPSTVAYRMQNSGNGVFTRTIPGFSAGEVYSVRFVYQHDQAGQKTTPWEERTYGGNPLLTLTIEKAGTGSGSVTVSPQKEAYETGEIVTISAIADTGSEFTGYSGDASGTAAVIDVVMNGNKRITANFKTKNSTTRPWQGVAAAVPGKIEGENFDEGPAGAAYFDTDAENVGGEYRTGDSVDIQVTTDTGGGYNIGWLADGEWLQYTINVTETADYDFKVRNASDSNGSELYFTLDGQNIGSLKLDPTAGWQDWRTDAIQKIALEKGTHTLKLHVVDGSFNVNYIEVSKSGGGDTTPWQGIPAAIPGRIEAEFYDEGPAGKAYYDSDAENQGGAFRADQVDIETCEDIGGGYNIGWLADGEWLQYTVNVTKSGTYAIAVRNASEGNGSTIHFTLDGANIGEVTTAPTGGWQTWQTDTLFNVSLTAGQHVLKLHIDDGDLNINYVEFLNGINDPFAVDKSRGEWTLVVVPDTQHYTDPEDDGKAPFSNMKTGFQWIVSKQDSLNIKMVQGLGDITDWNQDIQWARGEEAWDLLIDRNIPCVPNQGNHDDIARLNQVFPVTRFRTLPWWGGDSGGIENSYQLMTIGNEKYLFLNVESFDQYTPKRWFAMDWAKDVCARYPDRKVILATHNNWDTTDIREHLLANYGNIVMSNSGHVGAREVYFETTGGGGRAHNFVTDYQHDDYETMLIRYYVFKPLEDKVEYYTYSPVTKEFEDDDSSRGSIDLIQAD